MRRLLQALLIATGGLAAGCTIPGPWQRPPSPRPREAPPPVVSDLAVPSGADETMRSGLRHLARALAAANQLQTLEAQARMKAISPAEDFSLRFSAHLLFARPDRLRLRATKALGTEILDLALVGQALDVWLPRERTFYRGSIADLRGEAVDFRPEAVVGHALLPVQRFHRASWEMRTDEEGHVLLRERIAGPHNRLTLDPEDGRLLLREVVDESGQVRTQVAFDRYEPLPGLAGEPLFARRLHMRFPQTGRELIVVFTDLAPNPSVQASDFWLPVPEAAKAVRPLGPTGVPVRHAIDEDAETTGKRP